MKILPDAKSNYQAASYVALVAMLIVLMSLAFPKQALAQSASCNALNSSPISSSSTVSALLHLSVRWIHVVNPAC
ncbi:MAG: hypothetical protein FJX25_13205 [Alphaproteobacteria bacterium]|nr:hypothetical protein [Alphaproteobacteria bacterium]